MAKLAPIVFEVAQQGDAVAAEIIRQAARDLAELVATLYARMQSETEVKLALMGNIFKQRDMLLPYMQAFWNETGAKIAVVEPRFPAEIGAALLALQSLGQPLEEKMLNRLEKTLKKVAVKG
ncbi:MAG: hypothetical protein Q9P14_02125 [candidate division KSB1 bacterium]|nr:hypothetical protein [candidate division KSB1 bacterium]